MITKPWILKEIRLSTNLNKIKISFKTNLTFNKVYQIN
jgi:hypothetical protein